MKRNTKYLVIILIAVVTVIAVAISFYCLNLSKIRLKQHMGVSFFESVEDVKYSSSERRGFSSYYFTFKQVDSSPLVQMQKHLSLKLSNRLPVTNDNGGFPEWWPDELLPGGSWDEFKKRIAMLHQNGDLITYSARINKHCLVVIYYFPKDNRVYCQEWWHEVYM